MTGFLEFLALLLIGVFMLVGLLGVIIPIIPGTLLIWLGAIIYALVFGIESLGWPAFVFISLLGLFTGTADLWLPLLGAKTRGMSKRAMLLGGVGALIGTFILPLIGTIIGYMIGLILGEYDKRGDWDEARKAGLGGLADWGVATAVQLVGGFIMIFIFLMGVILN